MTTGVKGEESLMKISTLPVPVRWIHLRHKKKDSKQRLRQKLKQLRQIEAELQQEIDKIEEAEADSIPWKCVKSLKVEFPYSILAAVFSPSCEYVALLFSIEHGDEGCLMGIFKLEDRDISYVASISVLVCADDTSHLEQCFALEEKNGLKLFLTESIIPGLDGLDNNALHVLLLKEDQTFLIHKILKSNKIIRCLTSWGQKLITAGEEGTADVWDWNTENKTSCTPLPQATYKDCPISCICKCQVHEFKIQKSWILIGLSTEGSMAFWQLDKMELHTVIHHYNFYIKDFSTLSCSDGEKSEVLKMMGIVSERSFSSNQSNTSRHLSAIVLTENKLRIGKPFVLPQSITRLSVDGQYGLASTEKGETLFWDLFQGQALWSLDDTEGSEIVSIFWNGLKQTVISCSRNGVMKHIELSKI